MLGIKNTAFLILISFSINGCAKIETTIPPSIFLQVREVQKPTIENLGDIQNSYIELFDAYQTNLNILKSIKNLNK